MILANVAACMEQKFDEIFQMLVPHSNMHQQIKMFFLMIHNYDQLDYNSNLLTHYVTA